MVGDAVVRLMVEQARGSDAFREEGTISGARFPELPAFDEFGAGVTRAAPETGHPFLDGKQTALYYLTHLRYAVNFELHRRKVFWVDEPLAWMLSQTRLDIDGAALQLPFPSFAMVFQDAPTLDVMRAHFRSAETKIGEEMSDEMRTVTAYVTHGRSVDGGRDLDITFVADTPLPVLVTRSLHIRPDDDIETILSSDSFGIDPSLFGPVFRTPELRRLVHLVINAVLYATSLPAPWAVLPPERRSLLKRAGQVGGKRIKRAAALPKLGQSRSAESVFLLPGKITISRLRELQACERGAGAEVFSRFMVRGHWRRPPATWKDQLLRWIEPYWKGPAMGTLIEREYVMQS